MPFPRSRATAALAAGLAVALAAAAPARAPKPAPTRPIMWTVDYHAMPAFSKPLRHPEWETNLEGFLQTLCNLELGREGMEYRPRLVGADGSPEQPVLWTPAGFCYAAWMDALAAFYSARWYLISRHTWALSRSEAQALRHYREALVNPDDPTGVRGQGGELCIALAASLSPRQWQRLEAGEELRPRDLAPPQQRLLFEIFALKRADPNVNPAFRPSEQALAGDIKVVFGPGAPPANQAWLGFWWHTDAGGIGPPETTLDLVKGAGGRWMVPNNVPDAPLPVPLPRPAATRRSYASDPAFLEKLSFDRAPDWLRLFQALHEQTGAGFLVMGEWLWKRKPLPIRVAGRSAAEVMDDLAAHAKGEWAAAGRIWVLRPKPKSAMR